MSDSDHLVRFLFDELNIRGELVHLDQAYQQALEHHDYPPMLRDLLGRALAAAALLTATLKFKGELILQVQGKGPMTMLVVQCDSEGRIRGMLRYDEGAELPDQATLGELCAEGYLAITIDPEGEGERYQGIVSMDEDSLSSAINRYFRESEQLDTHVWLAADAQRATGMLLQRLPGEADDEDGWNRVEHLAETVSEEELLQLETKTLLVRLFHEETVRVFEPKVIHFRCSCSRERVEQVLRSLGQDELNDILEEEGMIEARCEYCGKPYRFDKVDAERLLSSVAVSPSVPPTRH